MSDNDLQTTEHTPGGIRELLALAFPMVVSCACDTVMTFTDRLFLSKLGPSEMNAAFGGGIACFMLMSFFIGLTGYSTALVAQYLGAGRKKNCGLATTQAMLISLLAYPAILLARPAAHWLFRATGIAEEQYLQQTMYFDILAFSSIIGLLRGCMGCFFSGIGKTRIVMIAALSAMSVNIVCNYILIFGKFGCPALGIRGAAYGTIIGGTVGLLIMAVTYVFGENNNEYGIRDSLKFDWKIMKKLLKFGYPAGLELALNILSFNGMILAFHACGPVTATAITITFNWDMVTFVPLIGIEIGVTSLVGRYMGAQQPDIANRATYSGLKCGWAYSLVMLIIFVAIPSTLVNVFSPAEAGEIFVKARPMAEYMVRVVALYILVEAIVIVFSGALRGAGDTFWAMCLSVGMHWILVAVIVIILHVLKMSPEAAWLGCTITFMAISVMFFLRYRSGKWRDIKVVHDEGEELIPPHDGFHESAEI